MLSRSTLVPLKSAPELRRGLRDFFQSARHFQGCAEFPECMKISLRVHGTGIGHWGIYFEECGRMGIRVGGLISILRVAALDSPRSPPKTVFCLISLPLYTADFKNRKKGVPSTKNTCVQCFTLFLIDLIDFIDRVPLSNPLHLYKAFHGITNVHMLDKFT
jgi:hypothetical protein